MTGYERAYRLSEVGHSPQKRKGEGGFPYFIHPKTVAETVEHLLICFYKQQGFANPEVTFAAIIEIYKIVAILHDYFEDVPGASFEEVETILLAYLSPAVVKTIIDALKLLTKRKGESYWHYLNRIKGNEIARFVKLRDLEHNMSDLDEGSLLDKYRLAYYYLNN
jgi:(p)ppGpp synthase/HD superfamily hydrolase